MTLELPKSWTPIAVRDRYASAEAIDPETGKKKQLRVQDLWTELPGALVTQAEARELAARGTAYIASQFTETHQFFVVKHRKMTIRDYVRKYDQ